MDDLLEKSSYRSRSLLFGLLQSCLLEGNALENCPLAQLRNALSLEEKYHYAMKSSEEEVNKILEQHEECFKKRIIASVKNNSI
jgi:hypothetical protein